MVAMSRPTQPERLAFGNPVNDLTRDDVRNIGATPSYIKRRDWLNRLRRKSEPLQLRTRNRICALTNSNNFDDGCQFLLKWYVATFFPQPTSEDWWKDIVGASLTSEEPDPTVNESSLNDNKKLSVPKTRVLSIKRKRQDKVICRTKRTCPGERKHPFSLQLTSTPKECHVLRSPESSTLSMLDDKASHEQLYSRTHLPTPSCNLNNDAKSTHKEEFATDKIKTDKICTSGRQFASGKRDVLLAPDNNSRYLDSKEVSTEFLHLPDVPTPLKTCHQADISNATEK